MAWIKVGVTGLAILGSMSNEADQNAAMEDKAKAFGVRKAGIMASKEQTLTNIVSDTKKLQEEAALVGADIQKTSAQAEAQARVNAAATGVKGSSVDITIAQADVNAANAQSKVDRKKESTEQQLKLNFVNAIINAETQVGTLDTSTTDQTGKHLLAGGSALLGTFL